MNGLETRLRSFSGPAFLAWVGTFFFLVPSGDASPPSNDHFSQRTILAGASWLIEGRLAEASLEAGGVPRRSESSISIYFADLVCRGVVNPANLGSRWWEWRPPRSGTVVVTPEPWGRQVDRYECRPFVVFWKRSKPGTVLDSVVDLVEDFSNYVAHLEDSSFVVRYPGTAFSVESGVSYFVQVIGGTDQDFAVRVEMPGGPRILEQPRDRTVLAGESTFLHVVAYGAPIAPFPAPPLAYQWEHEGVPLAGQTSPALLVSQVDPRKAGGYRVIVSDREGSVTSSVARILLSAAEVPPVLEVAPGLATRRTGNPEWLLRGEAGRLYEIESSTNLVDWMLQPVLGLNPVPESPLADSADPPTPGSSLPAHVLVHESPFRFTAANTGPVRFLRARRTPPYDSQRSSALWILQYAKETFARDPRGPKDLTYQPAMIEVARQIADDLSGYLGGEATECLAAVVLGAVGRPPLWPCLPEDALEEHDFPPYALANPAPVWNGP